MTKMTGIVLCAAAWLAAGMKYYGGEKMHLAALRSLSQAFSAMESELSVSLAPLPELLQVHSEGFAAAFLANASKDMERIGETDFSHIWSEALEACAPLLNEEEMLTVKALGTVLGRAMLETQRKALSDAAARLDTGAEERRRRLPTARRLSFGLSAAFGLLTAILLL